MSAARGEARWLAVFRRYVAASAILHLAWETAQLPLYTIWRTGSGLERAWAVLHCTGGDVAIAAGALALALVLVGRTGWPEERFAASVATAVAIGLGYTFYSEWLNVAVRAAWAYTAAMPTLPPLGTGLAPLLQWLVVPFVAFALARRR